MPEHGYGGRGRTEFRQTPQRRSRTKRAIPKHELPIYSPVFDNHSDQNCGSNNNNNKNYNPHHNIDNNIYIKTQVKPNPTRQAKTSSVA